MAIKAVLLMVLAFLLATAKASYMDEEVKERAVDSKSAVPAPAPVPPVVKPPTPSSPAAPAPSVATPSTPIYKPPTPSSPEVKPPAPAPPVVPPSKPIYRPPTPPVKTPPPAPPVNPPTPVPPVKPPTTGPMPPPVRTRSDCIPLCGQRCKLHSRKKICVRACMTCCDRCKCVPPGTYGNREKCGKCYTNMTTRSNKPKCP